MINRLGSSNSTTYPGARDASPLIDPNGASYLRFKYELVSLTSDGSDISTASKWGITDIQRTANSTKYTLNLASPEVGCEKTINFRSTVATTGLYATIHVDPSTLGVRVNGTSDGRYITFSSLGTGFQSITLVGASTLLWLVKCVNSTVGGFNAAGGIRISTAASSN